MKLLRLRGRKICDRVLQKGSLWKGKTMLIRYICGAPRHPAVDPSVSAVYVGTLVSAKVDKSAVRRNRMRRRCREAWRLTLKEYERILGPVQLLISPRSFSLNAPFTDIQKDVMQFLSTLPCPPPPRNAARTSSSSS